MASFRDLPHVFRTVGTFGFFRRVWQQVIEDNVFTWASALAYSWMFAIFPFLIFLLSLVPLLPDQVKPDVRDETAKLVDQSTPPDAASIIKKQIDNVLTKPSAGGFLSFGLILTIWAASGGMSVTMSALDKAYDIQKSRPYWKHRLVAIGLTLVVATLMILVMVLMPVGTGVIRWLMNRNMLSGLMILALDLTRYFIALALMFMILAIVYHFGPSFRHKFQPITPGAVFCVMVWLLLGLAFKLYLTKFGGAASYNKTYGAVAGAVILLLFFYIDALVLLVGAEINSEIDFAVLGIPDGSGIQPRESPSATYDPQQQATKRDLEQKRAGSKDAAAPSLPPHSPATEDGDALAGRKSGITNRALLLVGGVWFASTMLQKFHTHRRAVIGKHDDHERLKDRYPVTWALIKSRQDH